jgi:hypothetical protein
MWHPKIGPREMLVLCNIEITAKYGCVLVFMGISNLELVCNPGLLAAEISGAKSAKAQLSSSLFQASAWNASPGLLDSITRLLQLFKHRIG